MSRRRNKKNRQDKVNKVNQTTYVKCKNCKRLHSTLEFKYVCRRCILTEDEVNAKRICNKFVIK